LAIKALNICCRLRRLSPARSIHFCALRLREFDRGLQLTVRDNGSGFDRAQTSKKARLGVASMQQRVALHGGKVKIESELGYGTVVTAWLPKLSGEGLFVVHGIEPSRPSL
jgi:signal transduction histidine kinase